MSFDPGVDDTICPECGAIFVVAWTLRPEEDVPNYCPMCGAWCGEDLERKEER